MIGSFLVIALVRRFGVKLVHVFYPPEKLETIRFLKSSPKRVILFLLIFMIPGTPKDLFTYAIGLTDMSIPLYILLTTAARFPSVILSTLSGNAVGTKDYRMAVVFVIVTAVVSGVGVLIYRIFSKKHAEKKRAETEDQKDHVQSDET